MNHVSNLIHKIACEYTFNSVNIPFKFISIFT